MSCGFCLLYNLQPFSRYAPAPLNSGAFFIFYPLPTLVEPFLFLSRPCQGKVDFAKQKTEGLRLMKSAYRQVKSTVVDEVAKAMKSFCKTKWLWTLFEL